MWISDYDLPGVDICVEQLPGHEGSQILAK